MKKLSIRSKVTIWYSALMAVLLAAVLIFLLSVSELRLHSDVYDRLSDVTASTYYSIEADDGELRFDDEVDYFVDGIYISVYNEEGAMLYGMIPEGFNSTPFSYGKAYSDRQSGGTWSIYDEVYNVDGYGRVHIRAVTSDKIRSSFELVVRIALYALPSLLIITAIGGWFITKRAFLPVQQIAEAADSINEGKDLSKRINLQGGKDEIHSLARTFDNMFDRLEKNFEAEKRFTSDASHELRTPTAVIIAQCEYALENAATTEEYRSSLELILKQSKKMSALISQLLTLARADRGMEKLQIETVNISDLAEMTAEQLTDAAEEKQITLHTDITPDILMAGDETMLMRMLINLITNAITYGIEGGNIYISLCDDSEMIMGSIRDDGIGISPDDLPRIWDRFFQADPSRSSSSGSSGLGLSMVKWIVSAHKGSITAESEPGKGTEFSFTLPKAGKTL